MSNNYKPLPDGLIIKDSSIAGQGLFTTRTLAIGCNLGISHYRIDGEYIRTPLGDLLIIVINLIVVVHKLGLNLDSINGVL